MNGENTESATKDAIKLKIATAYGFSTYTGYPTGTAEEVATAVEAAKNEGYLINKIEKEYSTVRYVHGRRDAVVTTEYIDGTDDTVGADVTDVKNNGALSQIFNGKKKSIYKWKYVTALEYKRIADAEAAGEGAATGFATMSKPFDGTVSGYDTSGAYLVSNTGTDDEGNKGTGNGFYGLWVLDANGDKVESDAFFKQRANNYLTSYVENYVDEYGRDVSRTIGAQLSALENSLNNQFEQLINDSSDNILDGYVNGFTVDPDNEQTTKVAAVSADKAPNATWLYVDPTIGRDTNTSEISTSKGGWWYLVATDDGKVNGNLNRITTVTDSVADPTAEGSKTAKNVPVETPAAIMRATSQTGQTDGTSYTYDNGTEGDTSDDITGKYVASTNEDILTAKLFEVVPDIDLGEVVGNNNGITVTKVVSYSFPFVNGSFTLPSKELTNIFANAKISFQISFQAVQAFFPYTTSIDGIDYHWDLLGKEKALNIKNAIPVFNEAFDI